MHLSDDKVFHKKKNVNRVIGEDIEMLTNKFQILNQRWNRFENGIPVRSGRLKNSTGPVRPETDRLESYAQPVKFRQKPVKFRQKPLKK